MNYSDEQLEEFRRKAIELRKENGLGESLVIGNTRFNSRQTSYFLACREKGIPSEIIAQVAGTTSTKVKAYFHDKDRKKRISNTELSKTSSFNNSNISPSNPESVDDESNEAESLEDKALSYQYPQETRDQDLIDVIKDHEAIERIIVPLLGIGAYAPIVLLYGDRKAPGSERDKALSIFSTKAEGIVRKVEKLTECRAFPDNVVLYDSIQRMSSYARQELERLGPKKFK